ncbi:UNVERIFIED_CONTAM: hypothetical protein RMT77_003186 [Armadillidium vulgare]
MPFKSCIVICILALYLSHTGLCHTINTFEDSFKNSVYNCHSIEKHIYVHKLSHNEDPQGFIFHVNGDNLLELCLSTCCVHPKCVQLNYYKNHCYGYPSWKKDVSTSEFIIHPYIQQRLKRSTNTSEEEMVHSKSCTVGMLECNDNEFCKTMNNRRKNGNCACKEGFVRNKVGKCISEKSVEVISTLNPLTSLSTTELLASTPSNSENEATTKGAITISSAATSEDYITHSDSTQSEGSDVKKLVVNISNKTVSLAEGSTVYKDWVSLSAYALGDSGSNYKYNWNLLKKPDGKEDGSIKDMNEHTVAISNLVAGVYIFRVSVNGTNSFGEAVGNVTVLPAKHVNKPPVAVIVPPSQTVKLPNSGVILDGSGSSDDKKISSYLWELVMGPLGYKLKEETGPTLQMSDLIPGNYTIILKVKDEDGLEGNTTASVIIVKETDYPPSANAGGDKIIYMPQTEITLNGNMSTDDHEIVEWEWTKGPEDSGNAVDMQDTRTPYLHLSNLEEGHYHFILKVVDTVGQWSNSSSHVYVHSSSDNVLKAIAGDNQTVIIPITTAILNGSKSTGLTPQTKFLWKQLSGPNEAHLSSPTEVQTNASDLTPGTYIFQLNIWNAEAQLQNSSSNLTVTVIQDKNAAPVANAGGDFSVTLPVSVVIVNGSRSTDDVKIVKWLWQRDMASLAAGTVIKKSDETPVLLFTGVVPGRYVWNLTVWDDQGTSSSDSVSIIVKEGPNHLDEVEIVVGVSIETLGISQLNILFEKLELLLHNSTSYMNFKLLSINGQPMAGEVSLIVLGIRNGKIIKGTTLVNELKEKTLTKHYQDQILNVPILRVQTVVCQNNCSGHGECIQSTKECRCHSWWMESFIRRRYADTVPNCDWSVVYVFVGIIGTTIGIGVLTWSCYMFIGRRFKKFKIRKTKTQHYSLLDSYEDSNKALNKIPTSIMDSATDTDSETEILFESGRGSKQSRHKNGHIKLHKLRT